MPKLVQINVTANWGSTGRIAEDIGQRAMACGWDSYIAYGRYANPCKSNLIKIGNWKDKYNHVLQSRVFDRHGLGSIKETELFIQKLKAINPDIIHLHNIHGYYLNYPVLFNYFAKIKIPVIWTLHDCWPVTGHCAYFTYANCDGWKNGCINCKHEYTYPQSYFFNRSKKNYIEKRHYFNLLDNLTLVPVSQWLADIIKESFLGGHNVEIIHNGIDLNSFRPYRKTINRYKGRKVILGVSSLWEKRKGLDDFFKLSKELDENYIILLIGLKRKQIANLPNNIIGIERTNSIDELARYYSDADILVNPTYEDNLPTINIEALACGTPVITYNTGGSPEIISKETGMVVETGDVLDLVKAVKTLKKTEYVSDCCRRRAEIYFDKDLCFAKYIKLYNELFKK